MNNTAQKRAIKNYRYRLRKRGIVRFEVLGLDADRDQIRSFAKRLAQNDAETNQIRSQVRRTVSDLPQKKGGILAALRRSPLVGLALEIDRPFDLAGKSIYEVSPRHHQQCHEVKPFVAAHRMDGGTGGR